MFEVVPLKFNLNDLFSIYFKGYQYKFVIEDAEELADGLRELFALFVSMNSE